MHYLAQKIAELLVRTSGSVYEQDEIRFGIEIFLGAVAQIALILAISFSLGLLTEIVPALLAAVLYRHYSGGVHCEKYYRCTITSLCTFLLLGYIITFVNPALFTVLFIVAFISSSMAVFYLVPVDNPHNIITDTNQRKKLKQKTAMVLVLLQTGAIAAFAFHYYIAACSILVGILWQTFTITDIGHRYIKLWDKFFASIENIFARKEGYDAEQS